MRSKRALSVSLAAILGVVLTAMLTMVLTIGSVSSQDAEEAQKEIEKALRAERDPEAAQSPVVLAKGLSQYYPLFMGVDDDSVPAYLMDPITNLATTAFVGVEVWGSAYDAINDRILFNVGATVYEWSVGSGSIISLGMIHDPAGDLLGMVGLAHYDETLYGVNLLGNQAIWEINTETLSATIHIDYTDQEFNFGGIAADPISGTLYGTNDDESPNGRGLFQINPDGSGTLVTPYPLGQSDIDGLAISEDGFAYLVTDKRGHSYVYDLDGMAYAEPLVNPWTGPNVYSAGAWIPPSPDSIACNSPAIRFGAGLPSTWVTTTTTGTVFWSTTDDLDVCSNGYEAGGAPPGACADADKSNPGADPFDAELWTNSFSLDGILEASMDLQWRHNQLNNSILNVDITINGGLAWTNLLSSTADNPGGSGGDFSSFDLEAFLGEPDVIARFRYYGVAQGMYVHIDDVALSCLEPHTPLIDVAPDSLSSQQGSDILVTFPLTISNIGDANLEWELVEESPVRTDPKSVPPAITLKEPEIVTSKEQCATYEHYLGREPVGYAEICLGITQGPQAMGFEPTLAPTHTAYAHNVQPGGNGNFVSHLLGDFPGQTVIGPQTAAIYGYDFDSSAATLYAHNSDTMQLGTIDLASGAFEPIGASDPGTGAVVTGLAIDPLSNDAYVSTATGTEGALYLLDLATGALTYIGSDSSIAYLIDISINTDGIMHGLDISTDSLYTIDRATGAATLVGEIGVDIEFAQGMDFDNSDDTLYAWTYQGGGNNLYGTIDLETGILTPLSINDPTGEFEGATQTTGEGCVPRDLPWLRVSPDGGIISPLGSEVVEVTFDSSGLSPGVYEGQLCFDSNDFYRTLVRVPVSLEVEDLATMLPLLRK